MIRFPALAIALVLTLGFAIQAQTANAGDGFKPLFNGKDLTGWKFQLKNKDYNPEKAFVVENGEIQIPGDKKAFGYFYTGKSYKNYILRYSWTYPKDQPKGTSMNSGCLMHIQNAGKHKGVWPYSVEPQCRYKDHGKLFFIGFKKGQKRTQNFDVKAQKKALKPHYEWNTTEVVSKNGAVTVKINGVLVNSGVSGLTSGPIGFQSEGARIHFKDIKIKVMD